MARIVQKFGGSSVANAERIFRVAKIITDAYAKGNEMCVVLSAQGDTTDDLIAKAEEINPNASKREMDMLLACGEQMSIALMAMAIEKLGYPVVSLCGWQVGMNTSSTHSFARIKKVTCERVKEELDKKRIVLVAGFQGVDKYGDVTTLGRGGSDTTAVAAAAALRADECRIYTDVEGVFTADPRLIPEARRLSAVDSEEMLRLASLGSQVLHERSAALALRFAVPLTVLSSLVPAPGTVIRPLPLPEDEGRLTAVTRSGALVSLVGTHLHTFASLPERAAAALREAGLSPDAVLLTDGRLTVHVPEAQSLETLRCLHAAFLETKDHS